MIPLNNGLRPQPPLEICTEWHAKSKLKEVVGVLAAVSLA